MVEFKPTNLDEKSNQIMEYQLKGMDNITT